jgi:spore maturation protein CgeB
MNIAIFGLSITSSWGNGHATTYRALVRALADRGHTVTFFERDLPWYAGNRDLPHPPYCQAVLYEDVAHLERLAAEALRAADLAIVGSYVPDGIAVGDLVLRGANGVTAFYDIDTPVTLARLEGDGADYLSAAQIPRYDLYLSFTGGPTLERLQQRYQAPIARPLYCSVDPALYFPETAPAQWDLGYLGTYSADRQPALDERLLKPAREWRDGRFVVAGPQFPDDLCWPDNVERRVHLPPRQHPDFYCAQRFTLNVTRTAMVKAGYSPSVRLFEAAACGTPIISDRWTGLEAFFTPGDEIVVTDSADETLDYLRHMSEADRRALGSRARARVLAGHTAAHRAAELEGYARADAA